ncbi:hypothetical protein Tco_1004893 [Tanacetum coccineum]|uniref:Uncharacterized protein n=1 Tax=Tanacetum coccineum TaxID=301880 RepID=A0ABQ5FDC1_9ASTR
MGRKNAKSRPKLDDSTFDDLDADLAHGMDDMETEEAVNKGSPSSPHEEREEYTIEERAKFLTVTIDAQRKFKSEEYMGVTNNSQQKSKTLEDNHSKNQERWNLKSWNFYENCKVHTLTLEDSTEIHMLAERKYPLIKETLERMMSLKFIDESASDGAYDLLIFIQNQIDEAGCHDRGEKDL